jgi:hypothetical protein
MRKFKDLKIRRLALALAISYWLLAIGQKLKAKNCIWLLVLKAKS